MNVGGTGKLAMTDLKAMCEAAGFRAVRTYIASGNVLFRSTLREAAVKAALEARLQAHAGRPVGVAVRTDVPGNRVVAIFLQAPPPLGALEAATGQGPDEALALGTREIYVRYGAGMAQSKLRVPAAKGGTARNMNTVAKLAVLAAG